MTKNSLILISNQGLHPVVSKLKKQYGEEIKTVIITTGNVELNMRYAEFVAKKTKDILFENPDSDIFIVWSGMPIYNTVIYNVAKEVSNKEPIFLVWDKDVTKYEEFNLNVRNLIFGGK